MRRFEHGAQIAESFSNREVQTVTERVLLVMPAADRDEMLQVTRDSGFQFEAATTCQNARRALNSRPAFDVVVTHLTLRDGNWWSVYQDLTVLDSSAEIIVVMPRKEAKVSEILAHGVYAVLGQPLEREEVLRTLKEAVAQSPASRAFPQTQSINR